MGYKQIKISQPLGIQINCIPKLCTISYNCKLFLIKFLHKLEPKPHKPIVKSSLQHLKFTHFSVLPGFLMKDSQKKMMNLEPTLFFQTITSQRWPFLPHQLEWDKFLKKTIFQSFIEEKSGSQNPIFFSKFYRQKSNVINHVKFYMNHIESLAGKCSNTKMFGSSKSKFSNKKCEI